uniref:Uncharacterized protein n=1 Tax=Oryza nivara TaxID=4536 RepID=A0A0E0HG43_ORYNI
MGRADGPVPPPPSYPPTLAAEPASVLPSPFFSRILAACSSSRPHLSTTPPSPCVSSNSCRSASLAPGSSFSFRVYVNHPLLPFPFLSFPVAGATSPSGSGGIPFAIYPSLLPTAHPFPLSSNTRSQAGMTGAAAIRGTTEEKIVVFEDTSGVDNKYTIVQFTGERSAGELHLSQVAAVPGAVRWPPLRWRPKPRSAGARRPSLAKDNPRRSTSSTTPTPSHRALPRHCRLLHSGDRRSS